MEKFADMGEIKKIAVSFEVGKLDVLVGVG